MSARHYKMPAQQQALDVSGNYKFSTMKKLFFIILFFLTLESCKKESYDISLPSETMTGKNIMGFLYNGNIWESISVKPGIFYTTQAIDTVISCIYHQDTINYDRPLQISARMFVEDNNLNISNNSSIQIGLSNIFQSNGFFNFDTLKKSNAVVFYIKNKNYANFRNSFLLTLTKIDTLNLIISGNFSGTLYTAMPNPSNYNETIYNLNDSVIITKGRFDIKYIRQ